MDYSDYEVDYSSPDSCLDFITDELAPWGLEPGSDVLARLDLEAGTDPQGTKVFRPYLRMALILSRVINTTHLNEGDSPAASGKFRNAERTIQGWLTDQRQMDVALSLIVPPTGRPKGRGTTFSRIVASF